MKEWATRQRHRGGLGLGMIAPMILVLSGLAWGPRSADASRYTPIEWKQHVRTHADNRFVGQRKHLGWSRDLDVNFVDDLIDSLFGKGDSVDVLVELNDCYPASEIVDRLSRFATVTYLGRLVSCAYLWHVPYPAIDSLAALPEVAMVEWQTKFRPIYGTASRVIQAAESATYGTGNAARSATGTNWTGHGINIAIIDTGVLNGNAALPGAWRATETGEEETPVGFDATIYEDLDHNNVDDSIEDGEPCPDGEVCDEPGDGSTDPSPSGAVEEHGTTVAAVALAHPPLESDCRMPEGETSDDCAGVAPEAGLIDVRVWTRYSLDSETFATTADGDLMQGLDWVGLNRETFSIGVANISLSDYETCDGSCAICQTVNYLAALGIVMVVGHGNATCDLEPRPCGDETECGGSSIQPGTQLVASPAAASFAITVSGVYDQGTVSRTDDVPYSRYLVGPRVGAGGASTGPWGDKPDLAAPAECIRTLRLEGDFWEYSGTSLAAPQVAGSAALLLEAMESTSEDAVARANVKDLLLSTADDQRNGSTGSEPVEEASRPAWDPRFGRGILNVYDALQAGRITDLRFPSCSGDADEASSPCPLSDGLQSWRNINDIEVVGTLKAGEPITIKATVLNDGLVPAENFRVSFGIYVFGIGTKEFQDIGAVDVEQLDHGVEGTYEVTWTLANSDHQCVQVTIHYANDENILNNVTQRNLTVEASRYDVQVVSPYMVPATFHVSASSERPGWPCSVDKAVFALGGAEDCPQTVNVMFYPPPQATPGERADCNVEVFARPEGSQDSVSIGGVTVETYVPKPCRLSGKVVDSRNRGIKDVRLALRRDLPPGVHTSFGDRVWKGITDENGQFDFRVLPGARQSLVVSYQQQWSDTLHIRPRCGRPLHLQWDSLRIHQLP